MSLKEKQNCRQWLVSQKSLFYTSRFLACSSNLQKMKKKIRIKRHHHISLVISCTLSHQNPWEQINSGETFRSLSGSGCQKIKKNIGVYTDIVFAHATNEKPSRSTVPWKESECRKQPSQHNTQENHVNSSEFSSLRGSGRIKCCHTAAQRAWNSIGLFTSSSIGLAHSGSSQGKQRTNRGAKRKLRLWRGCACISFLKTVLCLHIKSKLLQSKVKIGSSHSVGYLDLLSLMQHLCCHILIHVNCENHHLLYSI